MSNNIPAGAPKLGPLPTLIFASRWLQLPLYLGLIVAQGVYVYLFGKELWHLIMDASNLGEQQIMLIVLGLIDVVMISNLLVMVIVGGYETFVSRLNLQGHPDQPEWLSHVNASVLKVKLAMAIIGISSIHLLKTFIEAGGLGSPNSAYTVEGVMWQTIIHMAFIVSAWALISSPAEAPSSALAAVDWVTCCIWATARAICSMPRAATPGHSPGT